MAIKIPTPNRDPVPSAEINNVVFAGAKIDEFATSTDHYYIDRMGVQRFTAAGLIYYYGAKFQQAIANSGYTVIGRYEDGIQTLSNYNEIIEYGGEFYKLKPGINPPFTTTGTNETSWANDSQSLVSVGDASLRGELSKNDGFKYIGEVNSLDELSSLQGKDGDKVFLRSSLPEWDVESGLTTGGGVFEFKSSLSSTNNKVTIFNGWVRRFDKPILSTRDLGLAEGVSEDHFSVIQAALDVMPSGFEFHVYGTHQLSANLIAENKDAIKFVGFNGKLTTKPYQSKIKVVRLASDGKTYLGGVISALNCGKLHLAGTLEIEGSRMYPNVLNSDLTASGEEHGVHARYCDDLLIDRTVEIHNIFGYGVLGIYCNRSKVFAYIHHVLRESAVNVFAGASDVEISCKIKEVGLYGVEIEDSLYSGASKVLVHDCDIEDVYWGIPTINNASNVYVTSNNVRRARYGMQVYQKSAAAYATTNINYWGNTFYGCPIGLRTAHPYNASIFDNKFDLSNVMAYGYTYPFNNLLFVDSSDRTIFYAPTASQFLSMVGKVIYIDEVAYTIIAAVTDTTKTGYFKDFASESDSLVKVTLSSALPEGTDIQTVKYNDWGTSLRGSIHEGRSVNLLVEANKFIGEGTNVQGTYFNSYNVTGTSTVNERFRRNDYINCPIWMRVNDATSFRDISDNKYTDGSQLGVSTSNLTSAVLSQIKMSNSIKVNMPGRSAVTTGALSKYFNSNHQYWCVGVRLYLSGFSGTGNLNIAIDGTQTHTIASYSTGTTVIEILGVATFTKGNHQLSINTANNDIILASCEVEIIIP